MEIRKIVKYFTLVSLIGTTATVFGTYKFKYSKGGVEYTIKQLNDELYNLELSIYKPTNMTTLTDINRVFLYGNINKEYFKNNGGDLSEFDFFEIKESFYFSPHPMKKNELTRTKIDLNTFIKSLKITPNVFWGAWIIAYLSPQLSGNNCGLYSIRNLINFLFNEEDIYMVLSKLDMRCKDIKIQSPKTFDLNSLVFTGLPATIALYACSYNNIDLISINSISIIVLAFIGGKTFEKKFSQTLRTDVGLLPMQVKNELSNKLNCTRIIPGTITTLISTDIFQKIKSSIDNYLSTGTPIIALINQKLLWDKNTTYRNYFNLFEWSAHYVVILSKTYQANEGGNIYYLLDTDGSIYLIKEQSLESLLKMDTFKILSSYLSRHPINKFNIILSVCT